MIRLSADMGLRSFAQGTLNSDVVLVFLDLLMEGFVLWLWESVLPLGLALSLSQLAPPDPCIAVTALLPGLSAAISASLSSDTSTCLWKTRDFSSLAHPSSLVVWAQFVPG